jgi:hypothetical protein
MYLKLMRWGFLKGKVSWGRMMQGKGGMMEDRGKAERR